MDYTWRLSSRGRRNHSVDHSIVNDSAYDTRFMFAHMFVQNIEIFGIIVDRHTASKFRGYLTCILPLTKNNITCLVN